MRRQQLGQSLLQWLGRARRRAAGASGAPMCCPAVRVRFCKRCVCVCILQALHHLCLYHKLHHCGCRRICASGVGSGGGGTGEGSASTGQPAKLWPNLALLATARRWSAKSLPLVLTERCLRHRQPHPYCLPVSRATVLFARRFGYYYSGTWDATGATISAEQAHMTWSENVRTEMGSAQSTRGCALPPLMWSRHGRQARLLICMALSRVLPGSMLVAHGSLPQPSAPAAAAASSAAAMCEEAGGPPHRCRPAPAATGFPSLLLPLSTCCQYLHRVKKVCLSRTLMNKSPAGQGRMTTRRQLCGRHVAHVARTIATSTIPPLRGPTQSRPSRSPPSIPHLLSPS
jgi:hypothetical protein